MTLVGFYWGVLVVNNSYRYYNNIREVSVIGSYKIGTL